MIESQFGHTVEMIRPLCGGIQCVFKFANGLGASVVKHDFSYGGKSGLWELCPITWDGDFDWSLYTEKTHDVIGHLTDEQVAELLDQIKEGKM